jgi:putative oxidoreductase
LGAGTSRVEHLLDGGKMKIAVVIARILMGLTFFVFGLNGFLQFIPAKNMPTGLALEFVTVLMQSHWVWVVSAFQLVGGILLLVNRYVPLALALLAPVIVNILTYHALLDHNGAAPGLVMAICWGILFYRYRANFTGVFVGKPI